MPLAKPNRWVPARHHAIALALLSLCVSASWAQQTAAANTASTPTAAPSSMETLLLDLVVNGQAVPGLVQAQVQADGRLVLPLQTWQAARLLPAGALVALPDGAQGYALEAVTGLHYELNRNLLRLEVTAPPNAFETSNLALSASTSQAMTSVPNGVYVNYDLLTQRLTSSTQTTSGMVETVAFSRWGSFANTVLLGGGANQSNTIRTDSYWETDVPGTLETLVMGDTISSDGDWSRPARFGGIRWARNFALAPGYITYPMPSLSGSAALPSTVEVLSANQRQVAQQTVAPGPFTLNNVPIVNGAGQLTMVVTNLMGVQTVLTQNVYGSSRLLAPGLTDYSLEVGTLRNNYGMASNDYGAGFAAATYRTGFSPLLTASGRIELQQQRQAVGVDFARLFGATAVGRAALAWSTSNSNDPLGAGSGPRYLFGLEHTGSSGNWYFSAEHFAAGFRQFADVAAEALPRDRVQLGAGIPLGNHNSLGLSYLHQTDWPGPYSSNLNMVALNMGLALGGDKYLNLYLSHQWASTNPGWTAGVSLLVPVDARRNISAQTTRDASGHWTSSLQASQGVPAGLGWGWNLLASDTAIQRALAGVILNTNAAQLSAQVNVGGSDTAMRLRATGSLGWVPGTVFATRSIGDGAFAIVQAGDLPGVPVLHANQIVATTDSSGRAVVPGLLPFQNNALTLDPAQLPLNVTIGAVDATVRPYARSGVLVSFPVHLSRNALVALVQEDGTPVPQGALVTIAGQPAFVVAKRGEVYLTDLQDTNALQVQWSGGACQLSVVLPTASADDEPHLGPLVCKGQQ